MKLAITSNGTIEGTKIKYDGETLTEDQTVTSVDFYASVAYSERLHFSYTAREKNDDGSYEIRSYTFQYDDDDLREPSLVRVKTNSIGRAKTDESVDDHLTSQTFLGSDISRFTVDMSKVSPEHLDAVMELAAVFGGEFIMTDDESQEEEEDQSEE